MIVPDGNLVILVVESEYRSKPHWH